MKKTCLGLLIISCIFLTSGCVAGQKIDYTAPIPKLTKQGNKTVAVGVHDQRPYVKNAEKFPRYVGTLRMGNGIPFDMETMSKKPLAQDMRGVLVQAFENAGYKAVPMKVEFSDDQKDVLINFKNIDADRFLLLTLNEWRNDSLYNTTLYYNAVLAVYNRALKQLAKSKVSGRKDLEGADEYTVHYIQKAVPKAFQELLEKMLNDAKVQAALH